MSKFALSVEREIVRELFGVQEDSSLASLFKELTLWHVDRANLNTCQLFVVDKSGKHASNPRLNDFSLDVHGKEY